jgi:hypothetical protein
VEYAAYRDAVTRALAAKSPLLAWQLNERLRAERHRPGRGLVRAHDRILWSAPYAELPDGAVVLIDDSCRLVVGDRLVRYSFEGWYDAMPRPRRGDATILTPPTSVGALVHGYRPVLHPTAG